MCRGQRSKAFGLATTQFPRSSQEINECICEDGFYILSCYQELCFRKGELGWLFLTRMKRQARLPKQKRYLTTAGRWRIRHYHGLFYILLLKIQSFNNFDPGAGGGTPI